MIRHAEAEGNIYRRAHGHVNGQIIGRGLKQIEQLKERFLSVDVDAVYSSDLTRAQITASAIAEPRNLPINTTQMLREVKMGVWEDITWGNMEYHEPELGRYFTTDPARWIVEGSETFGQVQERMLECIGAIAERHDGGCIAVFSHGFAIRAFMCALMNVASHESMKVPYCDNTAVALLEYNSGLFNIIYQSDNSHLAKETSTFANQTWWRGEKEQVRENMRIEQFDIQRDKELLELCRLEQNAETNTSQNAEAYPDIQGIISDFHFRTLDNDGPFKAYTAFFTDEPAGLILYEIREGSLNDFVDQEHGGSNATHGVEGRFGLIKFIYMREKFRRKGFGVQLLGQVVSDFRNMGCETLQIIVPADCGAEGFCLKYGFVKSGEAGSLCVMEKNIKNW